MQPGSIPLFCPEQRSCSAVVTRGCSLQATCWWRQHRTRYRSRVCGVTRPMTTTLLQTTQVVLQAPDALRADVSQSLLQRADAPLHVQTMPDARSHCSKPALLQMHIASAPAVVHPACLSPYGRPADCCSLDMRSTAGRHADQHITLTSACRLDKQILTLWVVGKAQLSLHQSHTKLKGTFNSGSIHDNHTS
jgi:hypothetical protein